MSSGFWCAHCNRASCWVCRAHDDTIGEIKTIGSRYCDAPECIEAERKECNCYLCRAGDSHRRGRRQHRDT